MFVHLDFDNNTLLKHFSNTQAYWVTTENDLDYCLISSEMIQGKALENVFWWCHIVYSCIKLSSSFFKSKANYRWNFANTILFFYSCSSKWGSKCARRVRDEVWLCLLTQRKKVYQEVVMNCSSIYLELTTVLDQLKYASILTHIIFHLEFQQFVPMNILLVQHILHEWDLLV